jgi:hypothetical protein
MVLQYTDIFHTLRSKLHIGDSKRHLVLKYHNGLHRYIQVDMDFLDVSSLRFAYRYVVKIKHKFKQRIKQEFGFANSSQQKHGKVDPTHRTKDIVRISNLNITNPSRRKRRVT